MRPGETGNAVRLIQQSMIDLKIDPMRLSTKKYGTPDGIYGKETAGAIKKYQKSKPGLKSDGVVGQNTMRALDTDLPGGGPKLPALPSATRYVVPGLVAARNQLKLGHSNLCWAYTYTMMVSWKRQQSLDARQLIANVGAKWVTLFDKNRGLSWSIAKEFYRAAGLRTEPLASFTVSRWAQMLRTYGPLSIFGRNNSLGGGHARMIYGIQDESKTCKTTMLILDPWKGADYGESFEKFLAKYEGAANVKALSAQIGHF